MSQSGARTTPPAEALPGQDGASPPRAAAVGAGGGAGPVAGAAGGLSPAASAGFGAASRAAAGGQAFPASPQRTSGAVGAAAGGVSGPAGMEAARAGLAGPTPLRVQRWILFGAMLVVCWYALNLFAGILMPFVAAAGIAYVLDPPCSRLSRAHVPRGLAAFILIAGLILVALLFVLLLYPLIIDQVGLLAGHIPAYARALSAFAARMIARLQQHLGPEYVDAKLSELVSGQFGAILSFLAGAFTRVVGSGYALFNVLSLVIVTPVVSFYLLRDWPRVVAMMDRWLPRRHAGVIRAQAREVDRILSAWVRGQAMCCMILAIYYALALSLVGLELGLVVGLTAGFLSFIPYVGSITGAVVSLALALAQFASWEGVLRVVVVFAVGQVLEGYVIYPRFLGDRVELPAVWVIFALFAGGAAFGFLGVMLAVPVAAAVGVLARFWLRRYLRSPLYLEPPV